MEGKLKEQLLAREREIAAVQARMQASYQDHVSETQQLQGKVSPTLCSAASSSGSQVAFGDRCVVFWRRLRCVRGPEPQGGARPHDAAGPWCSREKRHVGASSWDVASLGAVSISRHPPVLPVPLACLMGSTGRAKGPVAALTPVVLL